MKEIKAMFDRMNVSLPSRTPAAQPHGERQSDDVEAESSVYNSFAKEVNESKPVINDYDGSSLIK